MQRPDEQNTSILNNAASLLSRPYPDASGMFSKVEIGMWTAAVELLESRLFILYALSKRKIADGPKRPDFQRQLEKNTTPLSVTHIAQARMLVEQVIINEASRPTGKVPTFPFKEILCRLLVFKGELTDNPYFRRLFFSLADGFSDKEELRMPLFHGMPDDDSLRRKWYKYHGLYHTLLGFVDFNAPDIETIKFKMDWLREDESVLAMLFAYIIMSEQCKSRVPGLLSKAEKILVDVPSIKPLCGAMRALSLS